jgi:hypothetical protein
LYALHVSGAFFVTRAKSNLDAHRQYYASTDRCTGIIFDQTIALDGFYIQKDYPQSLRRIRFKDPETGKTLVFLTDNFALPSTTICALYKSRWQVELLFKWIKHQAVLWHVGKWGQIANLDRRFSLSAGSHHQKTTQSGGIPLNFATDIFSHVVRENPYQLGFTGRSVQSS